MKKLILVAALGLATLGMNTANAASANGNFDVTINLTSVCVLGTVAPVAFTYTSFGAAATGTGGGFNVKCTNSLPFSVGFTNAVTPAATETVTDAAVNLQYQLGLSAATGTGTGADVAFSVTGSMAANQAGTCATGTCNNSGSANKQRTLYVVY
jgi:spore coat protein U-like protein